MRKFSWVLVFSVLLISGCKKEDECQSKTGEFHLFTEKDDSNNQIGVVDPSDWTNDETWEQCEWDLFNATDTFDYSNFHMTSVGNIKQYPNPTDGSGVILKYSINGSGVIKYALVNDNFDVIEGGDFVTPTITTGFIAFFQEPIEPGFYRLYYQFLGEGKNIVYKGHGDIKVN